VFHLCGRTACNVLYVNSVDMESLTGPEALSRAIYSTFPARTTTPMATDVHFKVSSLGITLTDLKHRLAVSTAVLINHWHTRGSHMS